LSEVPDPELPLVSVVDLGLIGRVEASQERIRVELLPTFVGCHALEVMQAAIADRLAGLASVVEVQPVFDSPWTSDRITDLGRQRLIAMGVAPPGAGRPGLIALDAPVTCPMCGSSRTRLENAFGPTQCRTIRYCLECRNPFEAFKPI
jgi:ring-1,2-phenylacetyl-CoA epoxidase subunit PaaD